MHPTFPFPTSGPGNVPGHRSSPLEPEEPLKGSTQTLTESPFLACEGASFCGLFNSGSSDHTQSPTSKALGAQLIMLVISLSTLAHSQHAYTPHQGHGSRLSCRALPRAYTPS